MNYKGLSGGLYKPLSDRDVAIIHEASLSILEKTGITYESGLENTLDMLEKAGTAIDRVTGRIKFPRDLIMAQAAKAPARVMLYSRDGRNDLDLTENKVHLGTGGRPSRFWTLPPADPAEHAR